jgi:hypothetical protein
MPCYTVHRRESMKLKSESYPDRIRRIAMELSQGRHLVGVDKTVQKLRVIADELENNLKKSAPKKY